MAARFPVPIQEDVRDMLADLLGRVTAVDKVKTTDFGEDGPALIAEYSTDEGEVGVICLLDARLALRCGAALAMVPVPVVEEALRRGELPEVLLENVKEVVNILGGLFNSARSPHVRLTTVHRLPAELPASVTALLEAPAFRRDFAVLIEGYGDGRLALLAS